MSRWLNFDDVTDHGAKTRKLEVWSVHGSHLGTIKWFGRWRQYAFWPRPDTIYNPECLRGICAKIDELMALRRAPAPTGEARG